MTEKTRYATLRDVTAAIEKLEAKVPSRWEVRTLILAAIIVNNTNVPHEVTVGAIALGVTGLVGKALSVVFLRH
jgi:hypothetical protein